MTNRERLVKMTDEELAYYFCHVIEMPCKICPGELTCERGAGLANGLVKWLKAEAEEEA